jgi:thioredoxin reductase (NADPH)
VTYKYIDINNNPEAIEFVKQINNGKRIIPTFVVDDKTYTNPGISKLSEIIRE